MPFLRQVSGERRGNEKPPYPDGGSRERGAARPSLAALNASLLFEICDTRKRIVKLMAAYDFIVQLMHGFCQISRHLGLMG
jgi:hypothetical protein